AMLSVLAASDRLTSKTVSVTSQPFHNADRSLRILVAEDNAVNRQLVTALLTKRNHTVVTVINGLEAVAAATEGGFDLILMDVQMPELDGLQATAAIRKAELVTGARIPII